MSSHYGQRRAAALGDGAPEYLQKREEISQAAGRVFKSKGLNATKVNDIADEAEVDRATLYYYFGSKLEIFEEVVSTAVESNTLQAEEIYRGDEPAPVKLRNLIVSLMKSYEATYPYLYVYIQENLTQLGKTRPDWSQQMRQLNRRYESVLIDIIRQGIDDGSLRPVGDPTTITYGLLGMLGWSNRWFDPGTSEVSAEQIGNTFADIFLSGLARDPK